MQISKPYDNPFWEKSNIVERREKKKKEQNALNGGQLVPWQCMQAARANKQLSNNAGGNK